MRRLGDMMESRLLTGRGANVRAPSTCMQPSTGGDIDLFSAPVTVSLLGTFPLISYTPGDVATAIKGIGWTATFLVAQSPTTDPFSMVRFSVFVKGQAVPPYVAMNFQVSIGLTALSATQILVNQGEAFEIRVDKFSDPSVIVAVRARAKGWAYTPTAPGDRVLGSIAF